jgi:hypothetical protein
MSLASLRGWRWWQGAAAPRVVAEADLEAGEAVVYLHTYGGVMESRVLAMSCWSGTSNTLCRRTSLFWEDMRQHSFATAGDATSELHRSRSGNWWEIGWPRVPLLQKWRLSEDVPFWSGRSGEFRKALPTNVTMHPCLILLDRVVFGRAHPCFYSDHLVLEGAEPSSVLCCHQVTFSPWWSQRWRISWRPDWRTSIGGSSLYIIEGIAWYSGSRSSNMKVGAASQVKFRVLPFREKIQGLTVIGCVWQWPCWRPCFESGDYLQDENQRSLIGRRWRLCIVSLLGGIAFGEPGVQMSSWWCMYCCC